MPDGVVQWFDAKIGEAAVVRNGKVFPAAASEMEPVARHPGAHVHFDIRRDHGVEWAVDVTLRHGTRVSHHQQRFGTLAGARRPDTKGSAPFARPHPDLGLSLASHPLEVAHAWARCLGSGDLQTALSLYSPDAKLHADARAITGRPHLQGYLEASPLLGVAHDPDILGEDDRVLLRWEGIGAQPSLEVRCRIEHGQLAEQWIGEVAPQARAVEVRDGAGPLDMAVTTHGAVDEAEGDYAVLRLGSVVEDIGEPVLFARVKLTRAADPARDRPAIAQVVLDVDGELVRAHVAAHGMRESIDLLQRRLQDRLRHRAEHQAAGRTRSGLAEPGEWRHGDLPAARPDYFDRPPEERELVRHKSFAIDELTPDEAAFDLDQLDYDFHLFRDLASGEDALLERLADGSYRLTRLHGIPVEVGPTSLPLSVADHAVPELAASEAIQRLDANGEPFVFFANITTQRGNVVYRRYDGHYGLITPE